MSEEMGIQAKKKDFGEWYLEVTKKCEIVDQRYPVKGFPVYMPWGMFLIRQVIRALEHEFDETGHKPVTFPVVIPEKNLEKEREHVKAFHKEVFWITHAGENKLDEKLFLRPTSETAFYPMYSLWIRSHADLPLKLYQTCQVYRYETKMTKPLLRGREFFWIESHTAQLDAKDVEKQIAEDMKISKIVLEDELGIPFLLLRRPDWDKFPGAENTYAYDTLLPDGKCLQIATTHNLGQKFSKPFEIQYEKDGTKEFVHQTCFGPGISRIVAALIAVHGDDSGLVLPPHIAPIQVAIVPIPIKGKEAIVEKKCREVFDTLKKRFRVEFDDRDYRPGFKFNEWEMKGVPIRIEIGPKDVDSKKITAVKRTDKKKMQVEEKGLEKTVQNALNEIYEEIKAKAKKDFSSRVCNANTMSELKKIVEAGFARVSFCSVDEEGEKCAEKVEKETGAKIRGILFPKSEKAEGKCIVCSKAAKHVVYVARAY